VGHRKGKVLASGGIRNGLDVAKALALGSHAAGLALPFVRAVKSAPEGEGAHAAQALIGGLERSLKTAMLLSGSANLKQLRRARLDKSLEFEHRLRQLRAP
jgi:isopentenyl-diphosphate delta-isomerase